jgi:outer membrane immunogenic protein
LFGASKASFEGHVLNKQLTSIIFFVAAIAAGSAFAADMTVKAPRPAGSSTYNWAGFYLGVNGGYGWDPTSVYFDPAAFGTIVFAPGFVATSDSPLNLTVHPKGWLGGAHAGYNWQAGAWVYGLEADIDAANMKGFATAPFAVVGTEFGDAADFSGNLGLTQKIDSLGTMRARLGWAANTVLFYVSGGAGWVHVKTTLNTFGMTTFGISPGTASLATLTASSDEVRWGPAVGAGIELAIAQNWIAGMEYLWIDISGTPSLAFPGASVSGNLPVQIARVRLSYLFH